MARDQTGGESMEGININIMERKNTKTATKKKTVRKRTATKPADEPRRPLLLDEYKDVADLIKRGTADDRITAAVLCNYPVGNLGVEHLMENDLKNIASTFTAAEWFDYGYCGAVHETAFNLIGQLQQHAHTFIANGRTLYSLILTHKSAKETAVLLTHIMQKTPREYVNTDSVIGLAPSLYGWNIAEDKTVTPDFTQNFGNITFAEWITKAARNVRNEMAATKAAYKAFQLFRARTEKEITLTRKDAIYLNEELTDTIEKVKKNYAPSPEYQETADNTNEIVFPSWDLMEPNDQTVKDAEDTIYKILTKNISDYGRIVASVTGLNHFDMGGFVFTESKENETTK